MAEWPTPSRDTGIGLHGCSDCHWKPADFAGMVAQFKQRGITWKLLFVCDESKVDWARYLVNNDIMPILRIWPMYAPGLKFDIAHLEAYRDVGVKWFVVGNEPNLSGEYVGELPGPKVAAYKVAESYAARAGVVRDRGMWPLTPALALGGNINHRIFFQYFMERIAQLGDPLEILYPGGIGIHCRSCGNPLDKGPSDYDVSAREWEWFDNVVRQYCGRSLPMANTEAYDEPDWLGDRRPPFDWNLWESRNRKQFRWFDPKNPGYRYPDHVICNCFWLAKTPGAFDAWDEDGMWDNHTYAHQTGQGLVTNLWQNLPGFIDFTRAETPTPPPPPPPDPVQLRVYDNAGTKKSLEWAQGKYDVGYEMYEGEGWRTSIMRERCGPSSIDIWLYKDDGSAAQNIPVTFWWPGGHQTKLTEIDGKTGFMYSSGAYITNPAVGGPHWITIDDGFGYDKVTKLGMLAGTVHCHLELTYRWGKTKEPTPTDPLEVILPLAERLLAAIPVPADWAYPSKAAEHGFKYQVGGYSQVVIDNKLWGFQTFTNNDQSRYGVAYSPEGEYDKTKWALIERD